MGSPVLLVSYHTNLENYFLTMAYKLLLPCPLIYHAPNHSFLRSRRRSHAIITPQGRRQKKGENHLHIRNFTVVPLSIFSIKLLFPWPTRDRDISTHRLNFALPLPTPARVYYKGPVTLKER